MLEKNITMAHGSGGESTGRLIAGIFAKYFHNEYLDSMNDASVMPAPGGRIAMTTDSFVVTPVQYPGGDIGRLCVCGTVNDLLMSGAVPKYLSCGFILEEGLAADRLEAVVKSMAETAREAGVLIVTGDTKVIEARGSVQGQMPESGLMINTAGIGVLPEDTAEPGPKNLKPGDAVIVSGTLGEHHAAILASRMGLENTRIESDNAPLTEMVTALRKSGIQVHAMRDVTRGGLATVLNEFASASQVMITLEQEKIPVLKEVQDFCGILGLDPLYMGNEGKMTLAVAPEDADRAAEVIRSCRYGAGAAVIGTVSEVPEGGSPALLEQTGIGGKRVLGPLYGEGLPRIC